MRWFFLATEIAAAVVVSIGGWWAMAWALSRLARRYGTDPVVIPPLTAQAYRYTGLDESARSRAAQRRQHVDELKRAANLAAAGEKPKLLRAVK